MARTQKAAGRVRDGSNANLFFPDAEEHWEGVEAAVRTAKTFATQFVCSTTPDR